MVLLIGLAIPNLYSQPIPPDSCDTPPNCITNDSLGTNTPNATSNTNWNAANTINGWFVSHGSPQNTTGFNGNGVFMWARSIPNPVGEGIFTCYNFQQGHTYNICLRARNAPNSNQIGNLVILAANGERVGSALNIPNLPASETISNNNFTPFPWQTVNVTYTPNADYSQLLIYPFSPVDFVNGQQYEIIVDDIVVREVPTITSSVTTPLDGCNSTLLRVTGVPPGATVTWSPTTGLSSATGAAVTAQPCNTTQYTATITNGCNGGACGPTTAQFTVQVNNTFPIINNNPTVQCGDQIMLRAGGTPSCAVNYQWQDPQGNVVSTTATINIPVAGPTHTGIYTLTTTYPNGCQNVQTTIVDVVNCCIAQAEFIEGPDCNPVQFNDISAGNSTPVSWFWEFGDGSTSTKQNPKHWYRNGAGTNTVCLTVTYKDGAETCCDRYCKDITTCDYGCVSVADFKYSFVAPTIIQFSDLSVGRDAACQFNWDFGYGPSSNQQNPLHAFPGPGTYNVCLTVTYCQYVAGTNPPVIKNSCVDMYCELITIP